jgi:sulfur carrier protein ThiS
VELFSKVGIPEKYVFVVEKNGKAITKDSVINDNDEISLIPFISGG